jgi:hypothetical protein
MGLQTGFLVGAAGLGVTHAIEPDHVAGVAALTTEEGDTRSGALVGACFALGHVALVVGWIAAGTVIAGSFPAVLDRFGGVAVGVALCALAGLLAFRALTTRRRHAHGGESHTHTFLRTEGTDHGHGVRNYLTLGVVGAAFTLSPPVSMIAFLAAAGGSSVALLPAVAAYGVAIVATMTALGAGAGTTVERLRAVDPRVYAAAQGAVAVIALGLGVRVLLGL